MPEPQFRHELVYELWSLINDWVKPSGRNPLLAAVWMGLKGSLPDLFKSLDENDEIVEEIRARLAKVVGSVPIAPESIEATAQVIEGGDRATETGEEVGQC